MPIYEYQCQHCNHHADILQKMSEPALTICPQCKQASFNKMISLPAGFELKGTGWYVTDFKGGSNSKPGDNSDKMSK